MNLPPTEFNNKTQFINKAEIESYTSDTKTAYCSSVKTSYKSF